MRRRRFVSRKRGDPLPIPVTPRNSRLLNRRIALSREIERMRKTPVGKRGAQWKAEMDERFRELQEINTLLRTERNPVPQKREDIPDKMWHAAQRILAQEKGGQRLIELRQKFLERFGFGLDRIEHLLK